VREPDQRIPGAEPVHGMEGGCFATEDNDVVCLAVMLPPREREGVDILLVYYLLVIFLYGVYYLN
jgi:hypothetical protein